MGGPNGNLVPGSVLDRVRIFGVLVRDLGFPVIVAAFVLWRMDGAIRELGREAARTNELLRAIAERACVLAPAPLPPRGQSYLGVCPDGDAWELVVAGPKRFRAGPMLPGWGPFRMGGRVACSRSRCWGGVVGELGGVAGE